MSINQVNLLGNVGGDPEVRVMNNGDKVASFSLATSEHWKDKTTGEKKETTEWHRVIVFNQNLIGIVEEYVKKGSKVGVTNAQMKTRKYQDKDGVDRYTTEVVIGRFRGEISLEGAPKGVERDEHGYGQTRTREGNQEPASGGRPGSMKDQLNDEIPFAPEWR